MTDRTCTRCGHVDAAGNRFCTECGAPLAAAPPPAPPTTPVCSGCGQPLSPGLRFCTNCGTPVGAVPPPPVPQPAAPQPPVPQSPAPPSVAPAYAVPPGTGSGRRVWPLVLVAVVLLALVGAGVGYVLLRDDDSDGSSQVAEDRGDADRDEADDTEAPEPSDEASDPADEPSAGVTAPPTTPTTPTTPATPPAPTGVICWDGSNVAQVGLCSAPEGRAGLAYVFQRLDQQSCTDVTANSEAEGRLLLLQCFDQLPDGTGIKINYSQWSTVRAASDHYVGKGLTRTEGGGVYVFNGVANDGQLNAAAVYQTAPYSLSVYAPDSTRLSEALTTLVTARPPDQVRGHPVG